MPVASRKRAPYSSDVFPRTARRIVLPARAIARAIASGKERK